MVGLCSSKFVLNLPLLLCPSASAFLYFPYLSIPLLLTKIALSLSSAVVSLLFLIPFKLTLNGDFFCHLNPSSSQVGHGMRLKSQEFSFPLLPLSSLVSLPSKRLVFSSCFVLAPVAVRPETSSLRLYSVSSLPVSPSSPPVIIIMTYGSSPPPPPPFPSGYFHQWTTEVFYFFHCRTYVNACLASLLTYLTAELYLWYLLNLACPFKWPCRYQTCNGCSHWIKSTE